MKKINLLILIGFIMSCTQIPQTEPDWYNKTPFNDNMYYGVGVGESKIQALVGSLIDIQRINAIKLSSNLRFDSTSLGTSRFDSWVSSSEVIIHPNITLMWETNFFSSETYEEDAREFEQSTSSIHFFKYNDMNGKVYEYNEYYKEDYDLTKREFETNIRKDSIDVTIEDIIDDLIIFGYDYKHHYASDAHYVLLGINKDIIIDLNNSISKNRHQKLEELSPEEQARIKEMKEKFNRWLELE